MGNSFTVVATNLYPVFFVFSQLITNGCSSSFKMHNWQFLIISEHFCVSMFTGGPTSHR